MRKFALLQSINHNNNVRTHIFIDNCRIHESMRLAVELLSYNIVIWYLPKNTSHYMQPLDVFVIATLKNIHYSNFRRMADAAAFSGVQLDKSAVLYCLVDSLTSIGAQRSTEKSFLDVGLTGRGFDADAAFELFKSRATGDMRGAKPLSVSASAKIAFCHDVIDRALHNMAAVKETSAKEVKVVNDALVPVKAIVKGTITNAIAIAEHTVVHASAAISAKIGAQERAVSQRREKLAAELRRCRVCSNIRRINLVANWSSCACGEYLVCPPCSGAGKGNVGAHCGPGAAGERDTPTARSARSDLNASLARLSDLQSELSAVQSVPHVPRGVKRTKATEKSRVTRIVRGSSALLNAFLLHVNEKTMKKELLATDVAASTAELLKEAEPATLAHAARKKELADKRKALAPADKSKRGGRKLRRRADDDESDVGDGVADAVDNEDDDSVAGDDGDDADDEVAVGQPRGAAAVARDDSDDDMRDPELRAMHKMQKSSRRSVKIAAPWRAARD
jgi:hypothetical protein